MFTMQSQPEFLSKNNSGNNVSKRGKDEQNNMS